MPIRFTNNVKYLGNKAFVEREEYQTLALMKAAIEDGLNDGLIAFNHENGKHYVFSRKHAVNETTGKWLALGDVLGGNVEVKVAATATDNNTEKTYEIYAGGSKVGTIDIPKDRFIKAAVYKNDTEGGGARLELTVLLADGTESTVKVPLADLMGDLDKKIAALEEKHNTLKQEFDEHKTKIVSTEQDGHLSKEQYKALISVVGGVENNNGRVFHMTTAQIAEKEAAGNLPENSIIFEQA